MKRIIAILTAALLLLAFAACGSKNGQTSDPLKREDAATTAASGGFDLGSILSGGESGGVDLGSILSGAASGGTGALMSQYSPEMKAALLEQAKQDGTEITFNADGSTTVKEADGSIMTQNKDGTWTSKDADGGVTQLGGGWPDNEYTKLLPKPEISVMASSVDADGFTAAFSGATAEQIKAYVEKVKGAGFTVNAETTDQAVFGISIYSYTASNGAGYEINVTLSAGVGSLTLSKS